MKLIVQKVLNAKVENLDKVEKIDRGIIVYVGFSNFCDFDKLQRAVNKVLNLRIFEDEFASNFKNSVKSLGFEVLVISNFTLFGRVKKGSKPDFKNSLDAKSARDFYDKFLFLLRENYQSDKIKSGFFQEDMKITNQIDGPITLVLDF